MNNTVCVWIDDPNPIFRLGLASCLRAEGFSVAGESCHLEPEPDLDVVDVVVFDLGLPDLGWARRRACGTPARLLGLIGTGPGQAAGGDMCTVLERSTLTAESFVGSIASLTGGRPAGAARDAAGAPLTDFERDVLGLLADGQSRREIAGRLGARESTLRTVVDDVVVRLRCRNLVQAVALAIREGVI